jgi:hypothetical protein
VHLKHFARIGEGIDVRPILRELDDNPQLWNVHRERASYDGSPHAGISDIWLRFRPHGALTSKESYAQPYVDGVFYPGWKRLPSIHGLTFDLMRQFLAVHLGVILITRIPPGGKVGWHHDRGRWAAEYNNVKLYIPLKANDHCINRCVDESVVMRAGEAWTFNNLDPHAVENNGAEERITLIITMRTER